MDHSNDNNVAKVIGDEVNEVGVLVNHRSVKWKQPEVENEPGYETDKGEFLPDDEKHLNQSSKVSSRAANRTVYGYGHMQYGWFMVRTVLQPVPYPLTNSSPTVQYGIQYGRIMVIRLHTGYLSQTKVLVRDRPIQSHLVTRETSAGRVPWVSLQA